ncbi:hypothetical protein WDU94_010103 [Cyamophila willieti]
MNLMRARQFLFTCFTVYMIQLFHFSYGGEDSTGTKWINLDVPGDEWKGIKNFTGKNLCAGDQSLCKVNFSALVSNFMKIKADFYANCETDANLRQAVVCWLRHKPYNNHEMARKTIFECQFWSDNPTTSHARHAYPNVPP